MSQEHDPSTPPPQPPASGQPGSDMPTEPDAAPAPGAAPAGSARPRWLVPAVAAAVGVPLLCCTGFVAGAAAGSGEPEVRTVVETETATETVTETVQVDPSDEREAELDDREAGLDQREVALDEREAELQEWEQSLIATEEQIEAGTIPGDGIWVVGEDVEPGVYRAQGSGGSCYWARLRSLDGSDIITNHFGSANVSVEIHASDAAFETSGCGSWQLR
jgi:hypothetical protein